MRVVSLLMKNRCPNGEGIEIVHMLKDLPRENGTAIETGAGE